MERTLLREKLDSRREQAFDRLRLPIGLGRAVKLAGYSDQFGDITVHLAKEFGFCYGVDRAIDYAYETVHQFPERQIHLLGELIHNPHVNKRMTDMGIAFLYPDSDGQFDFSHLLPLKMSLSCQLLAQRSKTSKISRRLDAFSSIQPVDLY